MRRFAATVLMLCAMAVSGQPGVGAPAVRGRGPTSTQQKGAAVDRVLAWMPAGTETVVAMNGPFLWPQLRDGPGRQVSIAPSGDAVFDHVETMTLLDTLQFARPFAGVPVVQMMSGMRNFRAPAGLGMFLWDGATVVEFGADVSEGIATMRQKPGGDFVRAEQVDGQSVLVFRVKSEEDVSTLLVAFPTNRVMVVAADERSLLEVLGRVRGKPGVRALPESLPEWRYVDRKAQFWAVHHVPSGSKQLWQKVEPGAQGVGVTFAFEPATKLATVTYLMADAAAKEVRESMWNDREPGVRAMEATYREPAPGVLVGTYRLGGEDSAFYFMFVLEALLGRPILL